MHKQKEDQQALSRELYIFTTLGMIAGSVFGLYYGIFLYENTLDLKTLVIDTLLVAICSWIGYILGVIIIHKRGYLKTLKLTFFLLFLASLLTLFLIDSIKTSYPLVSIARGIPIGIGLAVIDMYLLKEFRSRDRGRFFNINLSIEFVIAIALPIIVGAVITFVGGYKATFILAALIYFSALLSPVRYNKRPHSSISMTDEISMLKRKGIKEFNFNSVMTSGMDQLNILLIAIVPFLVLGNVLSVGIVASAVALFAAATAYLGRNIRYSKQVKFGYFGNLGRLISNTVLAIFWVPWALIFQSLVNKGLSVFNDPVFKRLRLSSAEEVLETDLNSEALEFNLVTATMTLIGQSIALGAFLIILRLSSHNQITILRYILIIYGLWKVFNYLWVINMKKRFSKPFNDAKINSSKLTGVSS